MRMLASSLIALTFLAAPAAAEACRVMLMPEQRLEMGYKTGTIRGAAIVSVEKSEYLSEDVRQQSGMPRPWQASAQVRHVIDGDNLPETVDFTLGYGSSMCETEYYPLPAEGELFAVYFWYSEAEGRLVPWKVFSLDEARRADPRVLGLTTALRALR